MTPAAGHAEQQLCDVTSWIECPQRCFVIAPVQNRNLLLNARGGAGLFLLGGAMMELLARLASLFILALLNLS